ncbi:MAG: hypothetical protein M5U35_00060 [Roseovarius sp.]|nr:hypothetical protein [Roseovarius sp.]
MALCCLVGGAASAQDTEAEAQTDATNGMIFLINVDEDEDMDGLLQWEKGTARARSYRDG